MATQEATPAQLPEVAVDVLDGAVAGADVVVGAVVVTDVEDVEDTDVVVGAVVGTVDGCCAVFQVAVVGQGVFATAGEVMA